MTVHRLNAIGIAASASAGLDTTLGGTPASDSAVSSSRSKLVVTITRTNPSATNRAVA